MQRDKSSLDECVAVLRDVLRETQENIGKGIFVMEPLAQAAQDFVEALQRVSEREQQMQQPLIQEFGHAVEDVIERLTGQKQAVAKEIAALQRVKQAGIAYARSSARTKQGDSHGT